MVLSEAAEFGQCVCWFRKYEKTEGMVREERYLQEKEAAELVQSVCKLMNGTESGCFRHVKLMNVTESGCLGM